MSDEMESLYKDQTWELVKPPLSQKIVGCKWVYKKEGIPEREDARYKARLVAKGFTQREGTNYNEIFFPVVKHTSIRVLLAMAALYDLELEQLDVNAALLHGELEEQIFMRQSEGFVIQDIEDHVYLLKKFLHGLKQSPRLWCKRFDPFMAERGYIKSAYDSFVVVGYVDSDYAGDLDRRISLISYVFTFLGCVISWKATLQTIVALSTTEAESIAETKAVKEAIRLKGLIVFEVQPYGAGVVAADGIFRMGHLTIEVAILASCFESVKREHSHSYAESFSGSVCYCLPPISLVVARLLVVNLVEVVVEEDVAVVLVMVVSEFMDLVVELVEIVDTSEVAVRINFQLDLLVLEVYGHDVILETQVIERVIAPNSIIHLHHLLLNLGILMPLRVLNILRLRLLYPDLREAVC
ncbi:hypothetical protein RJ639_007521 [Escallonia herrerae]|uniref:Reverse transcriptase Ty1/copia-type domain-containing protein n=1 Tax=Escallonia herrerae TaxID=1293975 RepID=A0AA89AW08_9ASTE|nr:hypothetical protein RJ639_007521 [Escallonia herrerae]